ncbi:MAG: alcohol dehydrogenase catalytic domain-containing protein [Niveispirillum sp.]|uniref:alcohol dehydrogenase catalytic domain-containing protein n=1 Tax=Niveispirillum sp. TaxID=1917217 RepID=UPI00403522D9
MTERFSGLQLRSTLDQSGTLTLDLAWTTLSSPGPDEVVVQVEATPINPSDLAVLLGSATGPVNLDDLQPVGSEKWPTIVAKVPATALPSMRDRIGVPITPGAEGAGVVVCAGTHAQHLLGRRVAMRGGGMYAQYRMVNIRDCVALPDGTSAADGASMFINPLTALGFLETLKAERHEGIVHLAAASNLGRMLNRICLADSIPLVNVVRKAEQARILRDAGARYVLDSSDQHFEEGLVEALYETKATLAFDPIGGGAQASQVLAAMETAASRDVKGYNRYGTDVFKQLYIYGTLDLAPTVLDRWVGFAWSIGGWLLTHRLRQLGPDGEAKLLKRVSRELTTTFASQYTAALGLRNVLQPDAIRAYGRKATGGKYLITPQG